MLISFKTRFAGLAAALAMTAAHSQQLDAQQLMLLQQLLQQQRAPGQPAAQPTSLAAQQQRLTESDLSTRLSAWPAVAGPFAMERFRDGFSVNGQRVLDPEGRIFQYALDGTTGDITYAIESGPQQYLIKLMRQGVGQPVVIGSAFKQGGQWTVESVTGVRANGSRPTLSGRGFIVARDNALFRYEAGRGLSSSALPETHTLAAVQNGDISATGWVLLEKRMDTKAQEGGAMANTSLGQLFGAVKALGAAVGVNKSDSDYALFELASNKLVPIGISLGEKQAQILSQCRRQNAFVNICDQMDSVESIWSQGGTPNRSHYFWRVSWFRTPVGPVAVVMQDGIRKIEAIDLAGDRQVVVFERALGIGDWTTKQHPDGRVEVRAKLGFETASKEDVASLFADVMSAR
ncbi:hypothetical protein WDZ92_29895 [Nostoc sp. NIES-2111]